MTRKASPIMTRNLRLNCECAKQVDSDIRRNDKQNCEQDVCPVLVKLAKQVLMELKLQVRI